MKFNQLINRFTISFCTIIILIVAFSQCMNYSKAEPDLRGGEFAGSKACVQCHKDISNSYTHTEHYKTSRPITDGDLIKQFEEHHSDFYFNKDSQVAIEKRDSGIYQVAYV